MAREAIALASDAQREVEAATRAADASHRRAIAAERRASRVRVSVAKARQAATRVKEQRDRVVAVLNRRIPLHGGIERYMNDPDALLAIAIGLIRENQQLRELLDEVLARGTETDRPSGLG